MPPSDRDQSDAGGPAGPAGPVVQRHFDRAAALAQRLARMLQRDARVLAVFIEGSLADGTADEYSDIDWVVVTDHRESVAGLCQGHLSQCAELVYWRRAPGPALSFSGVTADWMRCDVTLLTPQEVKSRRRDALHVLWDRARIAETLSGSEDAPGGAMDVVALADEFLRGLGLLPVLVGRGELRLGVASADQARAQLTALLREWDGAPGRGGALRLDPFLSEESRGILDALPGARASRDAVIQAHVACARAFLPRARALAEELRLPWPERFEEVTRQRLRDELGIEIEEP